MNQPEHVGIEPEVCETGLEDPAQLDCSDDTVDQRFDSPIPTASTSEATGPISCQKKSVPVVKLVRMQNQKRKRPVQPVPTPAPKTSPRQSALRAAERIKRGATVVAAADEAELHKWLGIPGKLCSRGKYHIRNFSSNPYQSFGITNLLNFRLSPNKHSRLS